MRQPPEDLPEIIRGICDTCGEVATDAGDITLYLDNGHFVYQVTCPQCHQTSSSVASVNEANFLRLHGVRLINLDSPITEEEVASFAEQIEATLNVVEALKGDSHDVA